MARRRTNGLSQVQKVRRVACPETIGYGSSAKKGCGAEVGKPCVNADGSEREANHAARIKAHKIKFPKIESSHVGGGSAKDYYGRDHVGSSRALYDGDCVRCDESLTIGEGSPVRTKRGYVHPRCASGADDE